MGTVLQELQVVWGDIKKMSRSWTANEEMGRWWDDREEEFGAKLDVTKARLEEALYGKEHLNGRNCSLRSASHDCGDTCTKGPSQNKKYALPAIRLGYVERTLVALGQNT